MTDKPALTVRRVTKLDLSCGAWSWPFAEQRRSEIDSHFARLRETKPQLWNGRVLLAREPRFDGGTFSARYFETDFASFLAWRDWSFPDLAIINGFGMGALRGSDGGFVLGEMAAHTANAGRIYFPSGTPDPSDRRGDSLDMAGSVAREVAEEAGLTPDAYVASSEWDCIVAGPLIAIVRVLQVDSPAATIRTRILAHMARETEPELAAIHIVREPEEIAPAMPDFVAAFLAAQFRASPPLAQPFPDV